MGGADFGTAYLEHAEIYNLVRDAKITAFAIVSGDRHNFWTRYAGVWSERHPPAAAQWKPMSTIFPKDAPLRPLFLRDKKEAARSRTGPSTSC
jgi:alkaline phosphatase D